MTNSPEQLTLEAARQKLGLGPTDHAGDYLPQWREVEQILVGLANREQDEDQLTIYERDLASLRRTISTLEKEPPLKKFPLTLGIWAAVVVLLVSGGIWSYQKWGNEYDPVAANATLESDIEAIEKIIEKRRWSEAENRVNELRSQGAPKQWARETLARISEEQKVESGQQLGYFIGGAQASFEAGRIEEAKTYLTKVEKLSPGHAKIAQLRELIQTKERELQLSQLITEIEAAIQTRKWVTAEGQLSDLTKLAPTHSSIPELSDLLEAARVRAREEKEESLMLLARAEELDEGRYSAEALGLLEKAMRLNPSEEVRTAYQRMSAYGRVISVPDEFPTIGQALQKARARDRIQVAAGTYHEQLHLPAGVVLVGEGRKETIIECGAAEGAVLTMDQAGGPARVTSVTLRHRDLVHDAERFSVVAVSDGSLRLEDVKITHASGHGVAVVGTGALEMIQSEIYRSGWDGASVQGEGATAKFITTISRENLHHGIDFWEGGGGSVHGSTLSKNGRAGLVALSPAAGITVVKSQMVDNRELGVLVSDASDFLLSQSLVRQNALGGVVLQNQVAHAQLTKNQIINNREAGLVIERGSEATLSENTITGNQGRQQWQDAVFPTVPEIEIQAPPIPAPPREID